MMRSPPPPQSQNNSNYGSPYNGQVGGGGGTFAPAFGGFINDPTAQMGYQVGKTALNAGQEYMEQNVYFLLSTFPSDPKEHIFRNQFNANLHLNS